MEIAIGQTWRDDLGGKFKVVGMEGERFVYVTHPDVAKKNMDKRGQLVARSEFKDWTLLEDAPAMLER